MVCSLKDVHSKGTRKKRIDICKSVCLSFPSLTAAGNDENPSDSIKDVGLKTKGV